jgi:hypothetical protein
VRPAIDLERVLELLAERVPVGEVARLLGARKSSICELRRGLLAAGRLDVRPWFGNLRNRRPAVRGTS